MNVTVVPSPNFSAGRWFGTPKTIVIHSIVGNMWHADRQFTQRGTGVSAHYAVDGYDVHHYVDDRNTAWHSGNWLMNQRSIGIETQGGGRFGHATEETYRTTAQLIAIKCREFNIPCTRQFIRKHNEVVPTQCPSGIDVDRLVAMAQEILNPPAVVELPPIIAEAPVTPVVEDTRTIAPFPMTVTVTANAGLRVRPTADTSGAVVRSLANGVPFEVVDRVAGENVNGNNVWLKTVLGNWVWSGATNFQQVLDRNNWR